ncbi:HAMP domain-containing histidine kinase [Vagococcus coleopterorum]|uniref:histidine kinase n=1 Tax=Vagococcus coleopterorum TaxID=2714946 RepID=A0A6G8AP71_9ENTE|nr:HAMP domain-containing sensor histidine kinase [Vagococcus coleopterorum]QIL46871.1 HAMP domain-containing histidine kinase [Vagococcus coleopterorum]
MNNGKFSMLKKKLLVDLLKYIIVTAVGLVLLSSLFSGKIADGILELLQYQFPLDYDSAFMIYHISIRQNKMLIISIFMLVAIYFIFRKLINTVMTYFDEIDNNLNEVVSDSDVLTELSPELASIEMKINQSKQLLKSRELALKDSEMKKNDLVVYLAHDIKTPLTSIIGYLSFLVETNEIDEETRQKYLKLVLTKANDLEGLINEFFDITRFNMQDIVLTKQRFNLGTMLQQICDERHLDAREKNQKILVDSPDIEMVADAEKLARVFNNIIKNACLYGEADSPISVMVKETALSVEIEIANQGDTLTEEAMSEMFDKFIRLNRARTTQNAGSGLGLAIAKDIVNAHNGDITVHSNRGLTTFKIVLPK